MVNYKGIYCLGIFSQRLMRLWRTIDCSGGACSAISRASLTTTVSEARDKFLYRNFNKPQLNGLFFYLIRIIR